MKHQDMETMYGTVRHCHRSNVEKDSMATAEEMRVMESGDNKKDRSA